MLCQACGKNPATTHIKTIVNGELTEYSLCSVCAHKMGYENIFSALGGFDFSSLLTGFLGNSAGTIESVRCKGCGSTFEDIAHSGKVGCAECYHTFYDRLIPSIQRIHGNTKHCGKTPATCTAISDISVNMTDSLALTPKDQIKKLQQELQQAIEEQNFEQAAVLRDEIKALNGGEQK